MFTLNKPVTESQIMSTAMFYCYMPVFPISFYNFPWIYSHDSHVDAKHFTRYTRNNRSIHYTVNTNQILLLRHIKGWNNNSEPTIRVCVFQRCILAHKTKYIQIFTHKCTSHNVHMHTRTCFHTYSVCRDFVPLLNIHVCIQHTHNAYICRICTYNTNINVPHHVLLQSVHK